MGVDRFSDLNLLCSFLSLFRSAGLKLRSSHTVVSAVSLFVASVFFTVVALLSFLVLKWTVSTSLWLGDIRWSLSSMAGLKSGLQLVIVPGSVNAYVGVAISCIHCGGFPWSSMALGGFRSCYISLSPLVKASFPVLSGC